MSEQHNCPCAPGCALQAALKSIGGKWKLPVLCSLTANGASRYNELLRREYLEVPVRVEHELSEQAQRLRPILV